MSSPVASTEGMELGMGGGGDSMGLGMGVLGAEWDNGLEMQRILASLGVAGEYDAQETEQSLSELEMEMGWGFAAQEGMGVSVF